MNPYEINIKEYLNWYKRVCEYQPTIEEKEQLITNYVNEINSINNAPDPQNTDFERIKKLQKKINELNKSIAVPHYHFTEWLIIDSPKQWKILFDLLDENNNSYIKESNHKLTFFTPNTTEHKKAVKDCIKDIKKEGLTHSQAYKKGEIILLNWFEKNHHKQLATPEDWEYLTYCKERAFSGFYYDILRITAVQYLKNLLETAEPRPVITAPPFLTPTELTELTEALFLYIKNVKSIHSTSPTAEHILQGLARVFNVNISNNTFRATKSKIYDETVRSPQNITMFIDKLRKVIRDKRDSLKQP